LQIVHDYFQVTLKLSPIEAKAKFLEKLEKWTLFGSNFFFVSVRDYFLFWFSFSFKPFDLLDFYFNTASD